MSRGGKKMRRWGKGGGGGGRGERKRDFAYVSYSPREAADREKKSSMDDHQKGGRGGIIFRLISSAPVTWVFRRKEKKS